MLYENIEEIYDEIDRKQNDLQFLYELRKESHKEDRLKIKLNAKEDEEHIVDLTLEDGSYAAEVLSLGIDLKIKELESNLQILKDMLLRFEK